MVGEGKGEKSSCGGLRSNRSKVFFLLLSCLCGFFSPSARIKSVKGRVF